MKYELTVGLETHIELSTKSKMFCSCSTQFAGAPNTQCCPVCLGLPGALPVMNRQAVEFAVMAGLALNCKVANISYMDRKNYSYPDLPKAFQISQYDVPLCAGGFLELSSGKKIRITRIHIEEDAGKLVHKENEILIDYNRCGVPLIEIVTEPDFSSVSEVKEYVETLQHLMRYIGVSDCRMQEGSMRCDVNVSVRLKGADTLGTRTEIKNMNSVANMVRAIEYEFNRQCELLEKGEKVEQETLRYIEETGSTASMRSKEDAKDYRFFREPDLLSVCVSEEKIKELREKLPELPKDKIKRYTEKYLLSLTDANHLIKYRKISEFFDCAAELSGCPKICANFIITQMFSLFATEAQKEEFAVSITPLMLADLAKLLFEGRINSNLAKTTLEQMLTSGKSAQEILSADDLKALSDSELEALCQKAVESNKTAVADFTAGKEKALMALVGFVMRESRGKANAEKAKEKLRELLTGSSSGGA